MRTIWLIGVLLLTGCGSQPEAPQAGATGDVVPWAALPATHPKIPSVTIPASPDPAAAAAAAPCRADEVKAIGTEEGVAAGTVAMSILLTATGDAHCRVEGVPELVAQAAGGVVPTRALRDSQMYEGPVLVAPGHDATLWLTWSANWCTDPVDNDRIELTIGDGTVSTAGFGTSPGCYGTPGTGAQPIDVRPWAPYEWTPAEVRSALDDVEVSGDLSLRGAAGSDLDFEVTLQAGRNVVLDPCPDYTMAMYGDGVDATETWALNCAAVATRLPDGRPYLPAGQPVTFAMRITAPAGDVGKFLWQLNGSYVGAGGSILVQ